MAIIGIIGTHYLTYAEVPFHENQVIYTRKGFVDVIQDLGHIPLIIPIDKPEKARDYIKLVDKVLLTGGEDVSPQLYGEEPHNYLGKTSLERDFFELAVIEAAIEENKPILGVCRGLQILNVKFGGSPCEVREVVQNTHPGIVGLSEVRWPGKGEIVSGNYTMFYSGGIKAEKMCCSNVEE